MNALHLLDTCILPSPSPTFLDSRRKPSSQSCSVLQLDRQAIQAPGRVTLVLLLQAYCSGDWWTPFQQRPSPAPHRLVKLKVVLNMVHGFLQLMNGIATSVE